MSAKEATVAASTEADDDLIAILKESVEDFCTRSLGYERLRDMRKNNIAFSREHWQGMAELGWLAAVLPADCGGLSINADGVGMIARLLGQVAAPEPYIECAVVAVKILQHSEADPAILESLTTGESICVAAMGSVFDLPFTGVTAEDKDGWTLLNGSLSGVPFGSAANALLVPALKDGVPVWCYVENDGDAIEFSEAVLSDGTSSGHVTFNGARGITISAGETAERACIKARQWGAIAASNYQLGLAETLLSMTKEYVCTRKQFGKEIGSFQALQHRLVDVYLNIRVAIAAIEECVRDFLSDDDNASITVASHRAMHRSGLALSAMSREAIQLHGAMGYTDECDVGQFVNRGLAVGARYGRPAGHAAALAKLRSAISVPSADQQLDDGSLADLEPENGDWNSLDNETFRQVVRQWHTAHYPDELKNLRYRVRWEQCKDWYEKLYRRGFAAPGWPVEHGGMGLSPEKLLIFIEERERLGVVRTPDQGIIMVGPLLMKHGSPEQQAYYLPKALSGEHIWCQGYSEPNAGSDLASLRTSAVRDGDEFVINGQKIWTTMAQEANQMFCLVRTDQESKPQMGISFILIDFSSPGITVRPIKNIAGDEEFCEVFFDDVRVPCTNLVGEINQGWTIAKNLLSFERFFIGSPKLCRNALARAAELAVAQGMADDPVVVAKFTEFELEVFGLEALYKSFADQIRRGEIPGPDVSILKIFASEIFQSLSEFVLDLGGNQSAQMDGVEIQDEMIDALFPYYHARPTTIYGGSNEIQRNILAKFVLQLPMI